MRYVRAEGFGAYGDAALKTKRNCRTSGTNSIGIYADYSGPSFTASCFGKKERQLLAIPLELWRRREEMCPGGTITPGPEKW